MIPPRVPKEYNLPNEGGGPAPAWMEVADADDWYEAEGWYVAAAVSEEEGVVERKAMVIEVRMRADHGHRGQIVCDLAQLCENPHEAIEVRAADPWCIQIGEKRPVHRTSQASSCEDRAVRTAAEGYGWGLQVVRLRLSPGRRVSWTVQVGLLLG